MNTEKDLQRMVGVALGVYGRQHRKTPTMWPVENILNKGTFDLFVACGGKVAWVELKVAGPNAKPTVRAGQPGFGAMMALAGVPAVVLVGHPDGGWRLLKGSTTGDDWRECVLASGEVFDHRLVEEIFASAGCGGMNSTTNR